jgi:hypothetical protein
MNLMMQPLYIEHAYNVTNHWSKFMKFDFFLNKITPNTLIRIGSNILTNF